MLDINQKDSIDWQEYPLPNRKYQHYKGGIYEIITLAKESTKDETVVVYRSILFGSVHVRPFKEWNEMVIVKPKNIISDGEQARTPRFKRIIE